MTINTTDAANAHDLSQSVALGLPYLRRYARALTGSQTTGDRYAIETLEAILRDRTLYDIHISPRTALFQTFHVIWSKAGAPVDEANTNSLERRAQTHLRSLTKDSREALLLSTIEGFGPEDLSQILQTSPEAARDLIERALADMENSVRGAVMIIEDEAMIAMDIEAIVLAMGHRVTGIARTHQAAVDLGKQQRPDLILADIRLADDSSGIDAVHDLLAALGDIPVIFITAFPDLLLTGNRPEPAFLIGKPYTNEQLRSAVSQAMFFASTETLEPGRP